MQGLRIVHVMPGRLRIKVDGVKGNPSLAMDLERRLCAISIVQRAEVNALTGSILLAYDVAMLASLQALDLDDPRVTGLLQELLTLAESLNVRLKHGDTRSLRQWLHDHINGAKPTTRQRWQAQLRRFLAL
jgi:hypothetical protein